METLARKNYIHTCSCLFRNQLPDTFPEFFFKVPFLDYVMHLYIAQYGKIMYFPEVMAVYRVHGGGRWSAMNRQQQLVNRLDVVAALAEYFTDRAGVLRQLQKQRLEYLIQLMEACRDAGDRDGLAGYFAQISRIPSELFLEHLDDISKDYKTIVSKFRRVVGHPVSGSVIRLIARLKGDDDFGMI
jgi:hypothetical protein